MARESKLRKAFYSLFICVVASFCMPVAFADTFSCGEGYVKVSHAKVDGLVTEKCEKLWCMDLETGKMMGKGSSANNGYRATNAMMELSDNSGNPPVKCFGDRKWCSGEPVGVWNSEYGAYTKNGENNSTYKSYQKGGCFAWRLEQPECAEGMKAMLQDGVWKCVTETETTFRSSTIRRTGVIRRR